ncbi:CopG family transcriptional regulator [Streptomyces sp. enrichment culture]|uniref:CopG family transcriptional regulator n=1 Tax=Streptomyces sp. enrichment culture TaxID=1795815 RepID=UPI003F56F517
MSMDQPPRDDRNDARTPRPGTGARTAREAVVRETAREQAAKWHELLERLK